MKNKKIYLIIFLIVFGIGVWDYLNNLNLINILTKFIFDSQYRQNFGTAEGGQRVESLLGVIYSVLFDEFSMIGFDHFMIFSTFNHQIFLPLIVSFICISYYRYHNTIQKFSLLKRNSINMKNIYLKEGLKKSLMIAASCFLVFSALYIFVFFMTGGKLSRSDLYRELLIDLLQLNFYERHTYVYYYLDGIIRFGFVPLVYAFFACGISLYAKNEKQAFLYSNSFYYLVSSISFFLALFILKVAMYLNPSTIMTSSSYHDVKTLLLFPIHLIAILISYYLLERKWKRKEI